MVGVSVPRLDWGIFWETRGFLDVDGDAPVPRDELKETALANGWTEREFETALRAADDVTAVGDPLASNPDLQLSVDAADNDSAGDQTDEDTHDRVQTEPGISEDLGSTDAQPSNSGWRDVDFANLESNVWPAELLEREQWMGHVEKKPFAPWADRDHPDADADEDARWKWGITDNYVDGETIAMAEVDKRLDGRAFLQQPDGPYVYVDGDNVRDRETGDVHPAFVAILEHLGLTYADVSQSAGGVHAQYRGTLPDGVKQAAWQLDR